MHHFAPSEDQYFPYLDYSDDFYYTFHQFFEIEKCNFKDRDYYLDEVKQLIRDETYIFVGVYGIEHLSHPSLIVGYDDSNSTIFALEDDLGYSVKYYVHTFIEKVFNEAVLLVDNDYRIRNECDYMKLKFIKKVEPYVLSLCKVKENVLTIINILNTEKFVNFNVNGDDFSKEKIPDEFIRVHTRYSNRFVANKLLLQELRKLKAISIIQEEELKQYCDQIINNVDYVKLVLMKHQQTKKPIDPEKVEDKWKMAFKIEIKMWNQLLSYLC